MRLNPTERTVLRNLYTLAREHGTDSVRVHSSIMGDAPVKTMRAITALVACGFLWITGDGPTLRVKLTPEGERRAAVRNG